MLTVVIITQNMKKIQMILTWLFSFTSGLILSSLWITKSETYKIYIPIALILILLKLMCYDKDFK